MSQCPVATRGRTQMTRIDPKLLRALLWRYKATAAACCFLVCQRQLAALPSCS